MQYNAYIVQSVADNMYLQRIKLGKTLYASSFKSDGTGKKEKKKVNKKTNRADGRNCRMSV